MNRRHPPSKSHRPNHRQPGYLLIGIDPHGKPCGLKVTDELLLDLGALRSNVNLEPLPALTVQKHTLPEGDAAVLEVHPSDLPPVRYKGRVWIRVGPSRRGANQQEERILTEKQTALQKTFDARPCQGCTVDDLVLDLFVVTYLPAAVAREIIEETVLLADAAVGVSLGRAVPDAVEKLGAVNVPLRREDRQQEPSRSACDPPHDLRVVINKPPDTERPEQRLAGRRIAPGGGVSKIAGAILGRLVPGQHGSHPPTVSSYLRLPGGLFRDLRSRDEVVELLSIGGIDREGQPRLGLGKVRETGMVVRFRQAEQGLSCVVHGPHGNSVAP